MHDGRSGGMEMSMSNIGECLDADDAEMAAAQKQLNASAATLARIHADLVILCDRWTALEAAVLEAIRDADRVDPVPPVPALRLIHGGKA